MRICVVGSGNVGRSVAEGFARAGHEVSLASRSPGDLELEKVTVGIPAEVLPGTQVVVNATPGTESAAALAAAGVGDLDVVVLDLANAFTFEGGSPRLLPPPEGSVAEAVQAALPSARVVKTLNTVNSTVMTSPGVLAEPTVAFLSGDDAAAKEIVRALLGSVGWTDDQVIDLGDLATAREVEHHLLLWLHLANATGELTFNLRLVR